MTKGRMMKYEYDVAISYAGSDREIAQSLAIFLKNNDVNVFYDQFETPNIWGKNLYMFLADVYENKAEYCIVLMSKNYNKRIWTRHEINSAFGRVIKQKKEYILPIKIDDIHITGLSDNLAYLSIKDHTINEIGDIILKKLGRKNSINSMFDNDNKNMLLTTNILSIKDELVHNIENEKSKIIFIGYGLKDILRDNLIIESIRNAIEKRKILCRCIFYNPKKEVSYIQQEYYEKTRYEYQVMETIYLVKHKLVDSKILISDVIPTYTAIEFSDVMYIQNYLSGDVFSENPVYKFTHVDKIFEIYNKSIEDIYRKSIFLESQS